MPPQRKSKLQQKPSALKREHPALQKMKFIIFFKFFWARDPIETGFTKLKKRRIFPQDKSVISFKEKLS
jgi:hypothetical protein